ncbi:hypothetical protein B0H14DRAFT_2617572 [Mycena olivaceomarginata]|nr:hypothetical protein B0H14DRAFT_2617572 [Mycena olivaceomarginata]
MALSNPGINLILGPVILGVISALLFLGSSVLRTQQMHSQHIHVWIVFTQSITYYTSSGYKKDSWFINDLAGLGILHNPFRRCSLPADSTMALVGFPLSLMDVGLMSTIALSSTTPIFSAWRVRFIGSLFLQSHQFSCGLQHIGSYPNFPGMEGQTTDIKVECLFMCHPMYSERMALLQIFAALIPFGDAWLALSVDTTVHIPAQKSHWILHQLKRLPSMVDLITFTVLPNTNLHVIFSLLTGRMYTNTLLAIDMGVQRLNIRTKLCEDVGGVHSIPTAIRGPQVHVSVEQNQEVDITLEGYLQGRKSSGIPAVSNGSQTSVYQDGKGPVIA